MINFNVSSLERYLTICLSCMAGIIMLLSGALLVINDWQAWDMAVILGLELVVILILMRHVFYRIMSPFERGLLHIEAMRVEDYNQYARSDFSQGQVAEFHNQLKQLSQYLGSQKSRYDQHAFLVYQLIDQLNTPILVFNQKLKLTYANGAFSRLYHQPWQMFRHAPPSC